MTVLEVSSDAPLWAKYGADALLVLHIGGGAVGIATGWVAVTSRKGETIHRAAGRIFFIAMLICYVVATGVAPFLSDGQRVNTIAGLLALYMLLSAWRTVRRRETAPEWPEKAGLIMALMIIAMNFVFIQLGASSSTGMIDGASYEPLYLFSIIAFFAAAGDESHPARRPQRRRAHRTAFMENVRIVFHRIRFVLSWSAAGDARLDAGVARADCACACAAHFHGVLSSEGEAVAETAIAPTRLTLY